MPDADLLSEIMDDFWRSRSPSGSASTLADFTFAPMPRLNRTIVDLRDVFTFSCLNIPCARESGHAGCCSDGAGNLLMRRLRT